MINVGMWVYRSLSRSDKEIFEKPLSRFFFNESIERYNIADWGAQLIYHWALFFQPQSRGT